MTKDQIVKIQIALGHLRMAYDLRNIGASEASEYERSARRALAELAGEPYDTLREEGTRSSESGCNLTTESVTEGGGAAC